MGQPLKEMCIAHCHWTKKKSSELQQFTKLSGMKNETYFEFVIKFKLTCPSINLFQLEYCIGTAFLFYDFYF